MTDKDKKIMERIVAKDVETAPRLPEEEENVCGFCAWRRWTGISWLNVHEGRSICINPKVPTREVEPHDKACGEIKMIKLAAKK